jgi:3-hydroxyisobutyrate dehydrogenase
MKIALIGGGMVGQCFAQAFAAHGMTVGWIGDAKPTPELHQCARSISASVHTHAGPWLSEADWVFSAVFGSAAFEVAEKAVQHMQTGASFVDMTTADPSDMEKSSALFKSHGVAFIDVAITGAVQLHGAKTPLLCAGEKAAEVAALFTRLGTPIQVVGREPGDAAALKLLRSIFTKGLEALSIECLLTAEKRGLREQVHAILSDVDQGSLRALMESMVSTHIEHSARRQKEVLEAQRQMQQAGVSPLVTSAVEQLFARTTSHQIVTPYTGKDIESALEWLAISAQWPCDPVPATDTGEPLIS